MVGSLLKGECVIDNISLCDDVQSTIDCLRGCNVDIKINNNAAYIAGSSLSNPKKDLNCKNSGTAARLLLGLFAGQNISAKLIGDKSLSNRPMSRIIKPLIDAGAMIKSNNNNLPITIISGIKKPVVYKNKTKSAQVKSSLILSGLGLDNATYISYNQSTRDHLEKILKYLNFDINVGPSVCIRKSLKNKIKFNLYAPGDISNASFLIVAALIIPNSKMFGDFVISDNGTPVAETTSGFTVIMNHNPEILGLGDFNVPENDVLDTLISFYDFDGDPISYQILQAANYVSWETVGDNEGIVLTIAPNDYSEDGMFVLLLTDPGGMSTQQSVDIFVYETFLAGDVRPHDEPDDGGGDNSAPVASFSWSADGLTVYFNNTSTDADGDLLTYSWNF